MIKKHQKITLKNSYFFYSKNEFVSLIYQINKEPYKTIENKKKKIILDKINNFFKTFTNFKITTFFYSKSQNKNILFYKSDYLLDNEEKKYVVNIVKFYFKKIENIKINFEVSNIYLTYIYDREFLSSDLRNLVHSLLLYKTQLILPPHSKRIRKRINEFVMKYKNIKIKSVGPFGERRIKLVYKPDK
ncbi:hypothetical protein SCORR_v1c10080 [Spiroplasma corruscae]|uniref:R3H domain-containing protein n=1 Tax=Spiroplasma corruscae TaxID=216934 RepID=A0A222EQH7_9MOLU|nr:hypothetical protein [Spiroplasma corruscae]ASP28780.1 hypothetical protein SCORR_v1c10080 [Spiroplasma corruscae]